MIRRRGDSLHARPRSLRIWWTPCVMSCACPRKWSLRSRVPADCSSCAISCTSSLRGRLVVATADTVFLDRDCHPMPELWCSPQSAQARRSKSRASVHSRERCNAPGACEHDPHCDELRHLISYAARSYSTVISAEGGAAFGGGRSFENAAKRKPAFGSCVECTTYSSNCATSRPSMLKLKATDIPCIEVSSLSDGEASSQRNVT